MITVKLSLVTSCFFLTSLASIHAAEELNLARALPTEKSEEIAIGARKGTRTPKPAKTVSAKTAYRSTGSPNESAVSSKVTLGSLADTDSVAYNASAGAQWYSITQGNNVYATTQVHASSPKAAGTAQGEDLSFELGDMLGWTAGISASLGDYFQVVLDASAAENNSKTISTTAVTASTIYDRLNGQTSGTSASATWDYSTVAVGVTIGTPYQLANGVTATPTMGVSFNVNEQTQTVHVSNATATTIQKTTMEQDVDRLGFTLGTNTTYALYDTETTGVSLGYSTGATTAYNWYETRTITSDNDTSLREQDTKNDFSVYTYSTSMGADLEITHKANDAFEHDMSLVLSWSNTYNNGNNHMGTVNTDGTATATDVQTLGLTAAFSF